MVDTKKATASSKEVQARLATLTLQLAERDKQLQATTNENEALRRQNVQLASVIENDLKADLKIRVMARSDFTDADMENMTLEQLQQIDETLSKSKGASATVPYKSIMATGATRHTGNLTVGGLKGKSRHEILELEGDF